MSKHTPATESTPGLMPETPTGHLAPGGPLNQAAANRYYDLADSTYQ